MEGSQNTKEQIHAKFLELKPKKQRRKTCAPSGKSPNYSRATGNGSLDEPNGQHPGHPYRKKYRGKPAVEYRNVHYRKN